MGQDLFPEDTDPPQGGPEEKKTPSLEDAHRWPSYRLRNRKYRTDEKPGPDVSSPGAKSPG